MKNSRTFFTTIILFITVLTSYGQQKTISGTVTGIDGYLNNVEVSVIDAKTKVYTDNNGNYSITIPYESEFLLFRFKSIKQTCKIDNENNSVDIMLIPSEKDLYKMATLNQELRLCDIYLNHYPKEKNAGEIAQLKEKLIFIEAYNIAASQFSDTALQNYLLLYPEGAYTQKANDAIEIAAWQKARYINTTDSYTNYINLYPNGKAVQLAKEKIADLK